MDKQQMTIGRQHAEKLLIGNGGELGLLGSNQAYQQVWARDSMICGLGLWLCEDTEGRAIHRRSLDTLRRFQSELGKIPHNVGLTNVEDPALIAHGGKLEVAGKTGVAIEDTIHAGCVDGNLWYVIGQYYDYQMSGDKNYLAQVWPSLEKALLWLRYQDSNECGLLEVHEAMDWADLFANRYNVLFDNVLYYAAWKCMGELAAALGKPAELYVQNALDIHRKLNVLLWVGPDFSTRNSGGDVNETQEGRPGWISFHSFMPRMPSRSHTAAEVSPPATINRSALVSRRTLSVMRAKVRDTRRDTSMLDMPVAAAFAFVSFTEAGSCVE
jgi:glycogen debranching enzyme